MHIPVLYHEVLAALAPRENGIYIDGTLGGAGHAEGILQASAHSGRLLGLDRDPDAIARCAQRLAPYGERVTLVHSPFARLAEVAAQQGLSSVDGILLDLGVSSFQLDEADRGFSFLHDGPLDMRMDPTTGISAAAYLEQFGSDWKALAKVLSDWGEEKNAVRIARYILKAAQTERITTTARLAALVEESVGGRKGAPRHPATRTFQALRIAVNAELQQLEEVLQSAFSLLRDPGGVLAIITFHSLEDRIVKHVFREHEGREVSLQQGGSRHEGLSPRIELVPRKPVLPSEAECARNPRARSAKLRVARRRSET